MKTEVIGSRPKSNINLKHMPSMAKLFVESVSNSFHSEIKKFAERNRVTVSLPHTDETKDYVCSWCLKAYILDNASTFGISPQQISQIRSFSHVPTGHGGYYLDGQKVQAFSSQSSNGGLHGS